jgi:hypothetical protein
VASIGGAESFAPPAAGLAGLPVAWLEPSGALSAGLAGGTPVCEAAPASTAAPLGPWGELAEPAADWPGAWDGLSAVPVACGDAGTPVGWPWTASALATGVPSSAYTVGVAASETVTAIVPRIPIRSLLVVRTVPSGFPPRVPAPLFAATHPCNQGRTDRTTFLAPNSVFLG